MTLHKLLRRVSTSLLGFLVLGLSTANAQTFTSGSTGVDGAFAPTVSTTVTLPVNGVLNYTTVTIPAGVGMYFARNAANTPVTLLATGDVVINGVISVNGSLGIAGSSTGAAFNPGGAGGPGGFDGGQGGYRGQTNNYGAAGQGPGGGAGGTVYPNNVGGGGSYGASSSFVSLLPLWGGSGGGGGAGNAEASGDSGSGGGGATVIASTTKIIVNAGGWIVANGGTNTTPFGGGGGSGGAIRLVAPQITVAGTLQAIGGTNNTANTGRIRLEAFSYGVVTASTPAASFANAPGPVIATSVPALINLPTLKISSVGGIAPPATPGGSYSVADVTLSASQTNPVSMTLTATNTPVGTVFTVMQIPFSGTPTTVNSSPSTGTFASSTATISITMPLSQISVSNGYASFTLP